MFKRDNEAYYQDPDEKQKQQIEKLKIKTVKVCDEVWNARNFSKVVEKPTSCRYSSAGENLNVKNSENPWKISRNDWNSRTSTGAVPKASNFNNQNQTRSNQGGNSSVLHRYVDKHLNFGGSSQSYQNSSTFSKNSQQNFQTPKFSNYSSDSGRSSENSATSFQSRNFQTEWRQKTSTSNSYRDNVSGSSWNVNNDNNVRMSNTKKSNENEGMSWRAVSTPDLSSLQPRARHNLDNGGEKKKKNKSWFFKDG